jgi:ubiquinone/menaquinone biosynthesis C-methylase UbiE
VKRTVVPEWLDTDAGTPEEISASLADLRWFNRNFGGYSTTLALLRSVLRQMDNPPQISYLDVASASADNLAHAQLQMADVTIKATVLDRSSRHLPRSSMNVVCGDALALPFRDASFDVVGCSLFIHHLEPSEIVRFVREGLRVARHAFVINDLVRSRVHYWAASAGRMLYRSRLTRHDAPASVQRAYTPDELRQILAAAGYTHIDFTRHYFYRMGVIIWR